MAAVKTPCPITIEQFRNEAPRVLGVQIGDSVLSAARKEFSTGTLGWYHTGKVELEIAGEQVTCQAQVQVFIVNSKEVER